MNREDAIPWWRARRSALLALLGERDCAFVYDLAVVRAQAAALRRMRAVARAFYAIITGAMLLGMGLAFTPIDPMKALYYSAVVNGVLAAPLMAIMLLIGSNPRIMNKLTLPPVLKTIGWIATAVMAAAAVGLFVT